MSRVLWGDGTRLSSSMIPIAKDLIPAYLAFMVLLAVRSVGFEPTPSQGLSLSSLPLDYERVPLTRFELVLCAF